MEHLPDFSAEIRHPKFDDLLSSEHYSLLDDLHELLYGAPRDRAGWAWNYTHEADPAPVSDVTAQYALARGLGVVLDDRPAPAPAERGARYVD